MQRGVALQVADPPVQASADVLVVALVVVPVGQAEQVLLLEAE
jgi:hypothetical protein